jgi:DNA (cytosine-5)-methyltransferase 3A
MAIKILIGGSPCTHWSIAQKQNRETEPEGMGWELFKNYLIAKEKFKPDFFLYENNKSAAQAIKDQIAEEFGVGVDPDVRFTYMNSALVSAQNRQRFYVTNFGDIEQPEDRGIVLRDILESGDTDRDKARTVIGSIGRTTTREYFKKQQGTMAFEPLTPFVEKKSSSIVEKYGYLPEMFNPYNSSEITDKSPYLTSQCGSSTSSATVMCCEPVRIPEYGNEDKSRPVRASYCYKGSGEGSLLTEAFPDNPSKQVSDYVAEPMGYACPCEWDENGKPTKAISCADGKAHTVYEVKDGQITIKGKNYPIKLAEGYYIIRKLTVRECARLQTMPDDYCKAVSDSRAYAALGNGWTAEIIIWLLNHALKDVPRDEEIIVLSMYDGIATGRHCLDKMGFTNVTYHAYEIDKYPIQVAMDNYPDIIQHGDAFAVREDDWKAPQTRSEWLDELLGA